MRASQARFRSRSVAVESLYDIPTVKAGFTRRGLTAHGGGSYPHQRPLPNTHEADWPSADTDFDRYRVRCLLTHKADYEWKNRYKSAAVGGRTASCVLPLEIHSSILADGRGRPPENWASKRDSGRSSASHFSSFECTHLNIGV